MTARAPFRYWGSKARMAPWIIDRLPAHDHFVEGCAGSAAVLVAKPPTQAETVNDTYSEVVNFYRVMRDPDLGPRLVDLIRRYDRPGVLIFLDPPYEEDSRPASTGSSSAYVEDRFDHGAMLEAVTASTSASFAIVHYPHPRYDDAGLTIAGDYTSHRNRGPRADTNRDRQAERLYVLDRSAQEAQP